MYIPDFDLAQSLRLLTVSIIPLLLSIILHEVAHGLAARRLGDPTADMMGRLTLNPVPHLDPVGLICLVLTSLGGSFIIGWAKPVPVNSRFFRRPARDLMLVALAGPVCNFLLAFLFALCTAGIALVSPEFLLNFLFRDAPPSTGFAVMPFLAQMCLQGLVINVSLAWFNLLPIPPLDGSRVVSYFLPMRAALSYARLENYGFVILLVLLVSGVLGRVLEPLVRGSLDLLLSMILRPVL